MICNKITYPQRNALHVTHHCCSLFCFCIPIQCSGFFISFEQWIGRIVMDFLRWNFVEIAGRTFLIIWVYVKTLTIRDSFSCVWDFLLEPRIALTSRQIWTGSMARINAQTIVKLPSVQLSVRYGYSIRFGQLLKRIICPLFSFHYFLQHFYSRVHSLITQLSITIPPTFFRRSLFSSLFFLFSIFGWWIAYVSYTRPYIFIGINVK